MAKAHMETPVVANKAAESKSTKKNWIRGASKPTESRCTDHNNIQGQVAGRGTVGSTTSFAGMEVAVKRWLVIIFEICSMTDAYQLQG